MDSQDHNRLNDPPEPDDLDALFAQAFAGEPPRDAFVDSLELRLRQELLGRLPVSRPPAPAGEITRDVEPHRPIYTKPTRRRWFFGIGLAAAAVSIVMFSWPQPGYSWARMLQAIESRPWIQATQTSRTGEDTHSGWISFVHRIVAHRSPRETAVTDYGQQLNDRYQPAEGVIRRTESKQEFPKSAGAELVDLLLSEMPEVTLPAGQDDNSAALEVLSESWRRVSDAHGKGIELRVRVRLGSREFDLVFRVDPQTQLPSSCRVEDLSGTTLAEYRMGYPQQGPRSVAQLGVPDTVPVVSANADITAAPAVVANTDGRDVPITITPTDPVGANEGQLSALVAEPAPSQEKGVPGPAPGPVHVPTDVSETAIRELVDRELESLWRGQGIMPAEPALDHEFLRRIYLDLTGRIPTVAEVQAYISWGDSRRDRLIDELVASRDHATHWAAVWRQILIPRGVDLVRLGGTEAFETWLADRFGANAPYDTIVRELLLAEGRLGQKGPLLFYAALKMEPEQLAGQTARAFLGIRLECAQCHNHFFDDRIAQTDFWSYAAFFARISRPRGKMEMASPVIRVRDNQQGEVVIPDTDRVMAPKFPLGTEAPDTDDDRSRRQRLADWMVAPENPYFARATVNRVWAHLWGRGIVEPVDDMRPGNLPVSAKLLDDLAGYLIASKYDMRGLIRVLVQTQAYQLSSRSPVDDPSSMMHFARMGIKSFSAEQLYDSIAVATQVDGVGVPAAAAGPLLRQQNMSRMAFVEQFRALPGQATEYQSGIPQALTLMNGPLVHNATSVGSSGLLRSLQAPFFTDKQRLETLFLATLSRYPSPEEEEALLKYLEGDDQGGQLETALGDVLWALLNSAEFTLNH